MIYLRNRYYDPDTGRFITEDPVKDGTNWYVYCENNPTMFVDPSGEDAIVLTNTEGVPLSDYAPQIISDVFGDVRFGHMAILVQDSNGDWHYFSSGSGYVQFIEEAAPGWAFNSIENINKYLGCYAGYYSKTTYIGGDFSKSCEFFKDYWQKNKDNGNAEYDVTKNNCAQMVIKGLKRGNFWDGTSIDKFLGSAKNGIIPNNIANTLEKNFYNNAHNTAGYKKQINDQLWEAKNGVHKNKNNAKKLGTMYYSQF